MDGEEQLNRPREKLGIVKSQGQYYPTNNEEKQG
jgi:hypothetical protein